MRTRLAIIALALFATACASSTAPRQDECKSGYSVATGKCLDE